MILGQSKGNIRVVQGEYKGNVDKWFASHKYGAPYKHGIAQTPFPNGKQSSIKGVCTSMFAWGGGGSWRPNA